MKRYGKAAVFAAFIVLAITIYYVQVSNERMPQFRLSTLNGDSREADGLAVTGQYAAVPYGEAVTITAGGSRYDNERSFGERIKDPNDWSWSRSNPIISNLIRKYPDFMRGKLTADYQDDDMLVRTDLIPYPADDQPLRFRYRLGLEILDKHTGKSRSIQTDLSDMTSFNGISVLDVQRIGSVLKVAAEFDKINPDGRRAVPEIRVYDLDLSDGKITGSAKVGFTLALDAGQEISLNEVRTSDWTQPNDYLVLEMSAMEVARQEVTNRSTDANGATMATAQEMRQVKHQLAVYRYATGEVKIADLPLVISDSSSRGLLFYIGASILSINMNAKVLDIKAYGVADAKLAYEKKLTAQDLKADLIESPAIGPNRLYLSMRAASQPVIAAIDPTDGNVVFRGVFTLDDVEEERKKQMLSRIGVYSINKNN